MKTPSLKKAVVFSFCIHIIIFVISIFSPKKSLLVTPERVYKVTIVSTETTKSTGVRRAKKVRIPPPKKSPEPEKAESAPKSRAEDEIPKGYLKKKLSTIKQSKEAQEYKSEKLSELQKRLKLKGIREDAVSRADEAEVAPTGGEADEQATGKIYDSYVARVQASIYKVWRYPDIDIKGLKAVISVRIQEDGTIVVRTFESPSGNNLFDRSALKAISKASPVEPPPFSTALDDVLLNFIPDVRK